MEVTPRSVLMIGSTENFPSCVGGLHSPSGLQQEAPSRGTSYPPTSILLGCNQKVLYTKIIPACKKLEEYFQNDDEIVGESNKVRTTHAAIPVPDEKELISSTEHIFEIWPTNEFPMAKNAIKELSNKKCTFKWEEKVVQMPLENNDDEQMSSSSDQEGSPSFALGSYACHDTYSVTEVGPSEEVEINLPLKFAPYELSYPEPSCK